MSGSESGLEITSLYSPHVGRVKALLGSRGGKARREEQVFIADGINSVSQALQSTKFPIDSLYLTAAGKERLHQGLGNIQLPEKTFMVSEGVMSVMSETESPQGIVAICKITQPEKELSRAQRIAYFWQIQDPGNAGTVIRTADACGFDAVVLSPDSVDEFSPKVVRSTAGSLWNINVYQGVELETLADLSGHAIYAFDGKAEKSLETLLPSKKVIAIFGNEARGLPQFPAALAKVVEKVSIPMYGEAESLNLSSAASIVMFHLRAR